MLNGEKKEELTDDKEPTPAGHAHLAIKSSVRASLKVATHKRTEIARNKPNTSALEELIASVPRREDIHRPRRHGRLENAEEETHAVDVALVTDLALGEGEDGPEDFHRGEIVARELGTGDDQHGRDLEDEITDVVKGAKERVPGRSQLMA